MAGSCKPDDSLLTSAEMTDYEIISSNVNGSVNGLFDELNPNEWNTERVCYPGTFTIKFNKTCKIWRYGTESWKTYCNKFNIYDENDNNITDNTDLIVQYDLEAIADWQLMAEIKVPGTYTFAAENGLRIDSEWYLEATIPQYTIKYLNTDETVLYSETYFESETIDNVLLFKPNQALIGWVTSEGEMLKPGEIATNNKTLYPLFVEYEAVTDSSGNITSIKIKEDVYNILKETVDKYITTQDIEE